MGKLSSKVVRMAEKHLYEVYTMHDPGDRWQRWSTVLWNESASLALDEAVRMSVSSNESRANFPYLVKVRKYDPKGVEDLLDTKEMMVSQWLKDNPYSERQKLLDYMKYHSSIASSEYERILKEQGY
jgi:hypothetical protein